MIRKVILLFICLHSLLFHILAQKQDYTQNEFHGDSLYVMNPVYEFLTSSDGGEIFINQQFARYKEMAPVWDGTKSDNTRFLAKGKSTGRKGTGFSGYAGYMRGTKENTAWSDVANAPEFYPYLVADSTGGDYRYERYLLGGTLQLQYLKSRWAMRIDYDGSVHWRRTDPRPKNTVSNLALTGGYMYESGIGWLGASLSYADRKQHVSISIEEDKRKDMFYLLTGMGLFDHRYSTVESNFSRYYRGQSVRSEITYFRNMNRGWYGTLLYEHSRMNVEENDTRISAFLKNNLLEANAGYQLSLSEGKRLNSRISMKHYSRKGYEQIYKLEQSNSQTNVFVPVLLDCSQRTAIRYDELRVSSILQMNDRSFIRRAGASLGMDLYDETYESFCIERALLHAGVNYEMAIPVKKRKIEISGVHAMRMKLSGSASLPVSNRITEEMILPDYRYFSRNSVYNGIGISYRQSFKHFSLTPMVRMEGEFASGNRKAYALTIGLKLNI